jgi:hypothetical protein
MSKHLITIINTFVIKGKLSLICMAFFAVIPNRHIQDALKLLNIQDNSLRFTLETEIDGLDN